MTRPPAAGSRPNPSDILLALSVAVAEIVGTELVARSATATRATDPLVYGLLLANSLPLAFRDRRPIAILALVVASTASYALLGYPGGFITIGVVFGIWAAVAAGRRWAAALGGLVVMSAGLIATFVLRAGHFQDPDAPIWLAGWLVAGFLLGEASRGRRQYLAQVEQRAIEAERTREEEARRRAGEERLRIARELHDVLAHNISMINVQAGVAVHLLDKQPEQARSALVAISQASKEAMRELRATLGVLRQVDDVEPRSPAPGLAALDDLVVNATAAGLDVSVDTTGDPTPLPPGADLAAYRIVQESLTNAARHARADRVSISINHGVRDVTITIDDDGVGVAPDEPIATGNGLTGMRERATAVGGSLEAGPRPEGGFRVRAVLPQGAAP
jgi:signal transduction histidine kinase